MEQHKNYRKCPECKGIFPENEFINLNYQETSLLGTKDLMKKICKTCAGINQ